MAFEGDAAEGVGEESVILASFENRHAAEHMLMSLGRGLRKKADRFRCRYCGRRVIPGQRRDYLSERACRATAQCRQGAFAR